MKTIGLLGGMSWESTLSYYKLINEGVKEALGGLNSAKICMYSVNFSEIEKLQHQGKWEETASILSDAASSIEKGGADFILICTNTMHKVAPQIEASTNIPILHIADATAELLREKGVQKVGLLGTQFTMEQDFYKGRLSDRYGLDVIIPDQDDRSKVHNIIYKELCQGEIKEESRTIYLQIIEKLKEQGAEAVILGCTEIALLVNQSHTDVTLLDTTSIHAQAAVRLAIEGE
ncbi:aspartate/glutamate racemase family protein [Vibrio alginolyticus]|uniref:aspartate/glutamate racemase family protein n=1 Tax=Vibrio alginolyticus TaxID=663 RepID=UPI001B82E9E7|nr:aspartate/glutamate racemase family protein [Vibrio alginolyticus]ELC9518823.1 aspartate/glutamate racemase family protein [Vibrio alginolyticus]MCG9764588.1 aspartate/glutamate racemase family protein [Vibrio alginolyticus]HBC3810838.1 aspartate/glutamate racemase family protein [Vibrio alginolyticus]